MPPLLGNKIRGAAEDRPGRLEHQVTALQEVLQGGGGGGDAEDATRA